MKKNLKEIQNMKDGEYVKWNHLTWYKIIGIKLRNGWAYLNLEDYPIICTIKPDIEMPWSPTKP